MKFKWFLVLSCLAGVPMLANAGEMNHTFTGAVYAGHAPEAASLIKVARARVFLGYDVYGHRIYAWHHARRVLLGFNRFGRPIYGYIVNNRPVFRTLYEYRMIVRPARADWDWGGRHWDRRWAGRWDRGEHRGWAAGEHRGWVEGEHRGWHDDAHRGGERHDRDQVRPGDAAGARSGIAAQSGWDQNRHRGNAAVTETHQRPGNGAPASSGTAAQGNASGSHQSTQSSSQQPDHRHDRRQRHGDSTNQSPAPNASSTGANSPSAGSAPATH